MADRTVAVRLRAITDQYKRDMVGAANATKKFGSDSVAATKSVSTELSGVKTASTIVGGALLGLAGTAVIAAAAFDKQMSGVAAVTGATAGEMEKLRDAALKAGQATVYSASEAATAEAELAKAGIKTSDILGGALVGSLDLAAAGQLALGDAATIAAQAMNTFGLKGKDVSHIADVLAAGANKSAADVGQLGDALRQGGLVAKQTGLSLEDTVGVLSAFADRALVGSDAGTSLKTMLQRLTPQSQQAADAMDKLGIHAYDAKGNFVGLAAFAENLKKSMSRLTPEARSSAMAIIFGSDAVRGANVLYDLGAKGVDDYTKAVNDNGAASRMAATQMDNLAGDLEQLKGSVETALIESGSSANGVLREMVQAGTGVVNVVGQLPTPILGTGLAVTALGGAFLIAAPRVVAFNQAMAQSPGLALAAKRALGFTGALVGVEALGLLATSVMNANQEVEDLDKQLGILFANLDRKASTAGIDDLYQRILTLQDKLDNPSFGETLARGWDALRQSVDGYDEVAQTGYQKQLEQLKSMQVEYDKYNSVVALVSKTLGVDMGRAVDIVDAANVGLEGDVVDVAAAVVDYAAASSSGSTASHRAAAAMGVLADSTMSVEDRLKALKDQWDATTGALLGTSNATIAAEKALDDMSASIKENGNAWDIATPKGRANQSQVNDSIQTFEDLRVKLVETGQATEQQANAKMVSYLTQLRNELPKGAKAARAELSTLIAKYSEIPAKKSTVVTADTSQATAALNTLGHLIDATMAGIRLTITASGDINAHGTNTKPIKRAGGGWVTGPGTATSDSVRMNASKGEFVVNASSAAKNAAALTAINSGARVAPRTTASGGITYNVEVQMPPGFIIGSDAEVGRQIVRVLQRTQGVGVMIGATR